MKFIDNHTIIIQIIYSKGLIMKKLFLIVE